ncbi:MAG: hypothetical protein KGO94_04255 [Alphaproteobacteria bacterium]|nr:hypothetical protein [Alphaproteobacteria bacterium]
MNIRNLILGAGAVLLMTGAANAQPYFSSHEVPATDGKCQVGTMDFGTTMCTVNGQGRYADLKINAKHNGYSGMADRSSTVSTGGSNTLNDATSDAAFD